MSAGHHHSPSPDLDYEVAKLLANPGVRAYMRRPFRVSTAYKIPFTGGCSTDGRTYYIDPSVPEKDRPLVLEHERVEAALRKTLGFSYARAHALATAAERMKAKLMRRDWDAYKKEMAGIVRRNEHETGRGMPNNLDLSPYRESGMMHLVSGRGYAAKTKASQRAVSR